MCLQILSAMQNLFRMQNLRKNAQENMMHVQA